MDDQDASQRDRHGDTVKGRRGENKTRGLGDTEKRRIPRVPASPHLRVSASKFFDRVFKEPEFVNMTYNSLNEFGFNADNTIACVGVCRDEISQSLIEEVNKKWGYVFNLASLAGMFFAGKTGLMAAMQHSPIADDKERYVFYSFPHIAIDAEGRIGVCKRQGRDGDSIACGALNAFQKELSLKVEQLKVEKLTIQPFNLQPSTLNIDMDDIEYSLIKMRLLKELGSMLNGEKLKVKKPSTFNLQPSTFKIPDLLELTKITQKAIQTDLESALKTIVDINKSDYAVITGIQIHGHDGNYISPASCYAVVNGKKIQLKVE